MSFTGLPPPSKTPDVPTAAAHQFLEPDFRLLSGNQIRLQPGLLQAGASANEVRGHLALVLGLAPEQVRLIPSGIPTDMRDEEPLSTYNTVFQVCLLPDPLEQALANAVGVPDFMLLEDRHELDIRCNESSTESSLVALPKAISDLRTLETLRLRGLPPPGWVHNKKLRTLPDTFGNLSNLQRLDLRDNELTELPTSFCSLHNLRQLDLGSNELVALPAAFGELEALEKLDLSRNPLAFLPESFVQLVRLEELDLAGCDLCELPDSIGALRALRRLSLEANPLMELPQSFSQLAALQELNLVVSWFVAYPWNLRTLWQFLSLQRVEISAPGMVVGALAMMLRTCVQSGLTCFTKLMTGPRRMRWALAFFKRPTRAC